MDENRQTTTQHNQPGHDQFLQTYMQAQKISFKDIMEHVTGPVISIILHVIIIALLGTIVIFTPAEQKADITVEVKNVELQDIDKLPEPPEPPELQDSNTIQIEGPEINTTVTLDIESNSSALTITAGIEGGNIDVMGIKPGTLKLPASYGARGSEESRKQAMKTYGADVSETENAVLKALRWLKANQNPDGSWGTFEGDQGKERDIQYRFTSWALLAMLAHGEKPSSDEFGECVLKAIKRMITWIEASSGNYMGQGDQYTHPIIAYAISETYGMTKTPKARDAMNKAIAVIIDNINRNGSYGYWYDRVPKPERRDPITGKMPKNMTFQPPSDLSFAGWNYQALKAAHSAGCDLAGLDDAIELAIGGLKKHYSVAEGGYAKGLGGKPDIGMTALGILCAGLLGDGEGKEAKKSFEWLKKYNKLGIGNCSWKFNKDVYSEYPESFNQALYTWYYQTQALFQTTKGQGPVWKRWNDAFNGTFIKEQNSDGSWLPPAEKYGAGNLDPAKVSAEWAHVPEYKSGNNLKIYATTLCTLTLEVYYRHLPTYKLTKETKKKVEKDDLGLIIE